jgi:hypothetical protein
MSSQEILETEFEPRLERKLSQLLDDCPYVTTLLVGLESWFRMNGDDKGARIIEQTAIKMSQHEASIV